MPLFVSLCQNKKGPLFWAFDGWENDINCSPKQPKTSRADGQHNNSASSNEPYLDDLYGVAKLVIELVKKII
jgi:hypothetical protein